MADTKLSHFVITQSITTAAIGPLLANRLMVKPMKNAKLTCKPVSLLMPSDFRTASTEAVKVIKQCASLATIIFTRVLMMN